MFSFMLFLAGLSTATAQFEFCATAISGCTATPAAAANTIACSSQSLLAITIPVSVTVQRILLGDDPSWECVLEPASQVGTMSNKFTCRAPAGACGIQGARVVSSMNGVGGQPSGSGLQCNPFVGGPRPNSGTASFALSCGLASCTECVNGWSSCPDRGINQLNDWPTTLQQPISEAEVIRQCRALCDNNPQCLSWDLARLENGAWFCGLSRDNRATAPQHFMSLDRHAYHAKCPGGQRGGPGPADQIAYPRDENNNPHNDGCCKTPEAPEGGGVVFNNFEGCMRCDASSADPHSADPHSADPHSADPHSADPHTSGSGKEKKKTVFFNNYAN
eukprot:NODE_948_length_1216_cov_301.286204_g717_i0.p1 GENE.NODE_948_length_1216_cov_301.286204_g717_i0~~NODE_948_length_1216_cov_301.286204_g717_i0.p1  ORF type:complete len:350 (-),score=63.19 NODE_948_length_1216_cov_301.286204_g717_i0:165-1163(-)